MLLRELVEAEMGHPLSCFETHSEMESLLVHLYAATSFANSATWELICGPDNSLTEPVVQETLRGNRPDVTVADKAVLRFLRHNFSDLQHFRSGGPRRITKEMLAAALTKATEIASFKITVQVTTDGNRLMHLPGYLSSREIDGLVQRSAKSKRFLGMSHDWNLVENPQ